MPRTSRDFLFGTSGAGFVLVSRQGSARSLPRRLRKTFQPPRYSKVRCDASRRTGVAPHVIENLLNHHHQNVATTYNRSRYNREVTAALHLWDEHVRALVEGRTSNVVALERADISGRPRWFRHPERPTLNTE